jgi:hypothetical protein
MTRSFRSTYILCIILIIAAILAQVGLAVFSAKYIGSTNEIDALFLLLLISLVLLYDNTTRLIGFASLAHTCLRAWQTIMTFFSIGSTQGLNLYLTVKTVILFYLICLCTYILFSSKLKMDMMNLREENPKYYNTICKLRPIIVGVISAVIGYRLAALH